MNTPVGTLYGLCGRMEIVTVTRTHHPLADSVDVTDRRHDDGTTRTAAPARTAPLLLAAQPSRLLHRHVRRRRLHTCSLPPRMHTCCEHPHASTLHTQMLPSCPLHLTPPSQRVAFASHFLTLCIIHSGIREMPDNALPPCV